MLNNSFTNEVFDKQIEIEAKRWNITSIVKLESQKAKVIDFLTTQLDWLIRN